MSISLVVVAHTTETVRKGLTSVLFCEVCRLQGSLSIEAGFIKCPGTEKVSVLVQRNAERKLQGTSRMPP